MEQNPFNDENKTRSAPDATRAHEVSDKPASSEGAEKPAQTRRWLVGVIVVGLVFLTGFLPMWLKAGRHANERDTAQREVKLLQLENLAAAASVDARRGEYESARQAASQLFTALRAELDSGPRSALSVAQQDTLKSLLADRDHLITLLARSDPASAERLTEIYLTCRKALRRG